MIWLGLPLLLGMFLIWRMSRWPEGSTAPPLSLSIIIPARNEEHNIVQALTAIAGQDLPPLEVLVIDDHSEDGTAAAAAVHAARVISAPPLPDGWRGKTWACQNGAHAARGNLLLFMDADVILQPGALARIATVYRESRPQALSVGPYHRVVRPYEELSVIFNILTYAGMGCFSVFGFPTHPQGFFGPFLMIEKSLYDEIGGHTPVKAEILEHMSICPILAARGARLLCMSGRGVVNIRMYPAGLRSMVEGWTKAFAAGADKTAPAIMLAAVVWLSGAILAALAVLLVPLGAQTGAAWLLYGAYALGFYWMARRVGSFSMLSALLYPIPLVFYLAVFTRSLIRKSSGGAVTWKGRSIGGAA